uniref:BMERB domain containing 1 n=1 Tax=Paramormyrops kingsleyae TaxID=1676925 RepID=A0A3B3QAB8_9TELE
MEMKKSISESSRPPRSYGSVQTTAWPGDKSQPDTVSMSENSLSPEQLEAEMARVQRLREVLVRRESELRFMTPEHQHGHPRSLTQEVLHCQVGGCLHEGLLWGHPVCHHVTPLLFPPGQSRARPVIPPHTPSNQQILVSLHRHLCIRPGAHSELWRKINSYWRGVNIFGGWEFLSGHNFLNFLFIILYFVQVSCLIPAAAAVCFAFKTDQLA